MKTLLSLILGCFMLVFTTSGASADTDYRCLNMCITGGKNELTCMGQCTYHKPAPTTSKVAHMQGSGPVPPPPTPDALENHRVLATLKPIDSSQIMMRPRSGPQQRESKDYRCIAQCLQNRMQYDSCETSCTTVTMPNGTVIAAETGTDSASAAVSQYKLTKMTQIQNAPAPQPNPFLH